MLQQVLPVRQLLDSGQPVSSLTILIIQVDDHQAKGL